MLAIYKKELYAYFTNIIGWIFLAVFFAAIGLYHWVLNFVNAYGSFAVVISYSLLIIVFVTPVFTMRILAEETHQKTDQLLYTAPVSIAKIVVGKYLAMLTILFIGFAVISLYPVMLTKYGTMQLAEDYLSIFIFFMMSACYLAIGMFISSLVESQIVAAVITLVVFAFTIYASGISSILPTDNASAVLILSAMLLIFAIIVYVLTKSLLFGGALFAVGEIALILIYVIKASLYDGIVTKIFECFCVPDHISNGLNGVFSLADLVYYLSVIFMFLFFTVQSINRKRWN